MGSVEWGARDLAKRLEALARQGRRPATAVAWHTTADRGRMWDNLLPSPAVGWTGTGRGRSRSSP